MNFGHCRLFGMQTTKILCVGICILLWSQLSHGANLNCDELEGDERTYCLTLIVCQSLENEEARKQCIEAAANIVQSAQVKKRPEPVEDQPSGKESSPPPSSSIQTPVRPKETTSQETIEEFSRPDAVSESPRVFEAPVPDISSNLLTSENAYSRVNPDRFSAAIVYYRPIDYDKALIILANGIVFEALGRERSRFDVGDTIVARQSQRTARQHYVLTGGAAGSVSSYRVRCESPRPSKQTRVRCELANSILREREVDTAGST